MTENFLPPLIDSHCHLDFPEFDDDLDKVLARDPVIYRDVRLAKKKITNPSMRTKKIREIINIDELLIDPEAYLSKLEKVLMFENSEDIKKELREANKRLEEIKKMLK